VTQKNNSEFSQTPYLKFFGICLDKLFDNGRHKVDVSFLAHLTPHHQLTEWEIRRYSIETPGKQQNITSKTGQVERVSE